MKKLFCFSLLILALGCQNRDKFPSNVDPLLVGKWEHTAYEKVLSDGTREWKMLDSLTGKPSFIVRSDGAFLDGNGRAMCCGPGEKITVNGEIIFLKPTKPVPYNEVCELVDCAGCADNVFEVNGEELLWICDQQRSRYRRLP